jgi:polyhydroxyalkanoate synthesis regulator phasin
MSEEGITSFFNEVMSSERLRKGMARAGERFMENKRVFDRNVETVLDFVNIPSKKDVRELKARIDHLSSQLLNLSIKVDRLVAAGPPKAKAAPRRGGSRRGAGTAE